MLVFWFVFVDSLFESFVDVIVVVKLKFGGLIIFIFGIGGIWYELVFIVVDVVGIELSFVFYKGGKVVILVGL